MKLIETDFEKRIKDGFIAHFNENIFVNLYSSMGKKISERGLNNE